VRVPRDHALSSAPAAAVISEPIGITSHLSLPPFDVWRQDYLTINNERSAVNGMAFEPEDTRSL